MQKYPCQKLAKICKSTPLCHLLYCIDGTRRVRITATAASVAQWQRVGLNQHSCSTTGPITTWMGDCLWTGEQSWYITEIQGN